ncbi:MAG: ABC transporter ATP-binding protein [Candidatus Atribacteria bacterium]|nr:MAG: ABC transporter ATP-binding protein [Candidatus Atribacteria bacterium]
MVLELKNVSAGYGVLQILWGISLKVDDGEFVSLIGPNGAGKTTCLKAIAGLINTSEGEINFFDKKINKMLPSAITAMGLSFITEGGCLFTGMTVEENLRLGAFILRDKKKIMQLEDFVLDLFPRLAERKKQLAGNLSGGERKMLSIARGLMSNPKILLVDEPSLGLAPNLVDTVFEALITLNKQGVTILLVEQNVHTTLEITDRTYVIEHGRICMQGLSSEMLENDHVISCYLGIA